MTSPLVQSLVKILTRRNFAREMFLSLDPMDYRIPRTGQCRGPGIAVGRIGSVGKVTTFIQQNFGRTTRSHSLCARIFTGNTSQRRLCCLIYPASYLISLVSIRDRFTSGHRPTSRIFPKPIQGYACGRPERLMNNETLLTFSRTVDRKIEVMTRKRNTLKDLFPHPAAPIDDGADSGSRP